MAYISKHGYPIPDHPELALELKLGLPLRYILTNEDQDVGEDKNTYAATRRSARMNGTSGVLSFSIINWNLFFQERSQFPRRGANTK